MKEQLITYETAVLAKEKGFREKTYNVYAGLTHVLFKGKKEFDWNDDEASSEYAAPTQDLLRRWLKEKHNIAVQATYDIILATSVDVITPNLDIIKINDVEGSSYSILDWESKHKVYDSYEDAMEAGLKYALKYAIK